MNDTFQSIRQGLTEAVDFSDGKAPKAIVHKLESLDIKNLRSDIGMSQTEFASTFGISVSTLRHWERGDRNPNGPALVLLNILLKEPKAVLRALSHQ